MRHCHTQLVLIDGIEDLEHGADVQQTFKFLEHISKTPDAMFVYFSRSSRAIVEPLLRDRETKLEQNENL
ncbi:hypothetical protein [Streptomyces sp. NBC_00658]|uniref:hypothetical protein n=1 Tax=Streptomyces sp. NBC_00658 TaxID=2975800 RepID=UPI00325041BC